MIKAIRPCRMSSPLDLLLSPMRNAAAGKQYDQHRDYVMQRRRLFRQASAKCPSPDKNRR